MNKKSLYLQCVQSLLSCIFTLVLILSLYTYTQDVLILYSFTIVTFFFFYKIITQSLLVFEDIRNVGYIFLLFLCFLFPVIGIDDKKKDDVENRNLAEKPHLIQENRLNLQFGKEFETWLGDHFYKRQEIISFYSQLNTMLNRKLTNKVENNIVMMGRDNWLFYKAENSISNFQNAVLFSQEELEAIEQSLIYKKQWFQKHGIEFYVMVAPDKNRIYGEFFPKHINKLGSISKIEQLKAFLAKNGNDSIIYLYNELMAEKKNGLLYWKTDTHWNEYGAFIGYTRLMQEIIKKFPYIQPLTQDDFTITLELPTYRQDLMCKLQIDGSLYKDTLYKTLHPKQPYTFQYIKNEATKCIITHSSKPLKVIVFRDSFTTSMVPFISETFGAVEYIWTHDMKGFQEKILSDKPDIVIHVLVERFTHQIKKPLS